MQVKLPQAYAKLAQAYFGRVKINISMLLYNIFAFTIVFSIWIPDIVRNLYCFELRSSVTSSCLVKHLSGYDCELLNFNFDKTNS